MKPYIGLSNTYLVLGIVLGSEGGQSPRLWPQRKPTNSQQMCLIHVHNGMLWASGEIGCFYLRGYFLLLKGSVSLGT